MKETNASAMDFNTILGIREAYIEQRLNLIDRTKANKIWQNTYAEVDYFSASTVIHTIENVCIPYAHNDIDEIIFLKYYVALINHLSKNYYKNWNLIEKIESGTLETTKWPNYKRYVEASAKAISKFDASPEALELQQIEEEWRNLSKTPRGNFSNIDWSIQKNRSQFCEWLNSCSDKDDAQWLLNEINCTPCFDYEDFCISAPFWFIYDEFGIIEYKGLLSDLTFLLNHTKKFDSYLILQVAISNGITDAITNHPEEMLTILKEDGYSDNFPEQIVKALEEKWPEIPDELQEDYKQFFDELKEYYC